VSSRKLRRNRTNQPLVNAAHYALGKKKYIYIVNNTYAFFDDNKEICLEVNAGKTKYIFMFRQPVNRTHDKIITKSYLINRKNVAKFIRLGMKATN
jgi:hypothetical protein